MPTHPPPNTRYLMPRAELAAKTPALYAQRLVHVTDQLNAWMADKNRRQWLERTLNRQVREYHTAAVKHAVRNREPVVSWTINLRQAASKVHGNPEILPPKLRGHMPLDHIVECWKLLGVESGYGIHGDDMSFSIPVVSGLDVEYDDEPDDEPDFEFPNDEGDPDDDVPQIG